MISSDEDSGVDLFALVRAYRNRVKDDMFEKAIREYRLGAKNFSGMILNNDILLEDLLTDWKLGFLPRPWMDLCIASGYKMPEDENFVYVAWLYAMHLLCSSWHGHLEDCSSCNKGKQWKDPHKLMNSLDDAYGKCPGYPTLLIPFLSDGKIDGKSIDWHKTLKAVYDLSRHKDFSSFSDTDEQKGTSKPTTEEKQSATSDIVFPPPEPKPKPDPSAKPVVKPKPLKRKREDIPPNGPISPPKKLHLDRAETRVPITSLLRYVILEEDLFALYKKSYNHPRSDHPQVGFLDQILASVEKVADCKKCPCLGECTEFVKSMTNYNYAKAAMQNDKAVVLVCLYLIQHQIEVHFKDNKQASTSLILSLVGLSFFVSKDLFVTALTDSFPPSIDVEKLQRDVTDFTKHYPMIPPNKEK